MAKAKKEAVPEETVLAVKGFDKNWQCRGYQFEVGKTYTHEGTVRRCEGGFHSCEFPLHVFDYYPPGESVYAVVEASGSIDRETSGDTKLASAKLHIRAELKIPELVTAAIKWITDHAKPSDVKHVEEDQSASSATGYQSASSATGKNAVAMNIGVQGKAMATENGAIVLCNHDDDYNIRHIRASKVGENGIMAGVWYILNEAGEFV